jgi:hypothetical protein
VLVFSTSDYLGLHIQRLYTLQEIARIKDIILHSFNNTLTGKLYKTTLELFYIELGMSSSQYSSHAELIASLTTPTLIQSTMIFLATHDIQLRHPILLKPLRLNDSLIMEALAKMDPPPSDLVACNYCRIFLKVCWLSEIATGDGTYLTEDAWNVIMGERSNHIVLAWPQNPRPSATAREIWRKWITKAYLGRGRRLRSPLGDWLQWDNKWKWYASEEGDLFSLTDGKWYAHRPILRHNRLPLYTSDNTPCSTLHSPQRATVYFKKSQVVCTGSAAVAKPQSFLANNFSEHLL